MLKKLYQKSEILFAVLWIVVYVVGTSLADNLSKAVAVEKSFTLPLHLMLVAVALIWVFKNGLQHTYGLCKPCLPAARFLYYIPLAVLCTVNFWFGVRQNLPWGQTVLYMASMFCVGFLEELIFRGFLFVAMAKENLKSAILVSSLTFGIGHIVNLINGSGAMLLQNLCQICYAVAFGFLFVILFYKGKSLLPCIIAHSAINGFSIFSNTAAFTWRVNLLISAVLCLVSVGYALVLLKSKGRAA